MRKGLFLFAAMSGFFSVALGAFAAHGLKNIATAQLIHFFNLGIQYQFYHTFAIIVVVFAMPWIRSKLLVFSAYFFIAGILLFSGSLYVYALIGIKWLGMITPIGGVCFLIGWLLLAVSIFNQDEQ